MNNTKTFFQKITESISNLLPSAGSISDEYKRESKYVPTGTRRTISNNFDIVEQSVAKRPKLHHDPFLLPSTRIIKTVNSNNIGNNVNDNASDISDFSNASISTSGVSSLNPKTRRDPTNGTVKPSKWLNMTQVSNKTMNNIGYMSTSAKKILEKLDRLTTPITTTDKLMCKYKMNSNKRSIYQPYSRPIPQIDTKRKQPMKAVTVSCSQSKNPTTHRAKLGYYESVDIDKNELFESTASLNSVKTEIDLSYLPVFKKSVSTNTDETCIGQNIKNEDILEFDFSAPKNVSDESSDEESYVSDSEKKYILKSIIESKRIDFPKIDIKSKGWRCETCFTENEKDARCCSNCISSMGEKNIAGIKEKEDNALENIKKVIGKSDDDAAKVGSVSVESSSENSQNGGGICINSSALKSNFAFTSSESCSTLPSLIPASGSIFGGAVNEKCSNESANSNLNSKVTSVLPSVTLSTPFVDNGGKSGSVLSSLLVESSKKKDGGAISNLPSFDGSTSISNGLTTNLLPAFGATSNTTLIGGAVSSGNTLSSAFGGGLDSNNATVVSSTTVAPLFGAASGSCAPIFGAGNTPSFGGASSNPTPVLPGLLNSSTKSMFGVTTNLSSSVPLFGVTTASTTPIFTPFGVTTTASSSSGSGSSGPAPTFGATLSTPLFGGGSTSSVAAPIFGATSTSTAVAAATSAATPTAFNFSNSFNKESAKEPFVFGKTLNVSENSTTFGSSTPKISSAQSIFGGNNGISSNSTAQGFNFLPNTAPVKSGSAFSFSSNKSSINNAPLPMFNPTNSNSAEPYQFCAQNNAFSQQPSLGGTSSLSSNQSQRRYLKSRRRKPN